MERAISPHQPTLRHLLATESLAEAQVIFGEQFLDHPTRLVSSQMESTPAPGALIVLVRDTLDKSTIHAPKGLSGIILISQPEPSPVATAGVTHGAPVAKELAVSAGQAPRVVVTKSADPVVTALLKQCKEAEIPLVLLPAFDTAQAMDDIRIAFLKETRTACSRIQSVLLSVVLDDGLEGLVEQLHEWLDRPVVVESADYELLAQRQMGSTPTRLQKRLTDEAMETLKRLRNSSNDDDTRYDSFLYPIRQGRRLSLPIVHNGDTIAGYISVTLRPTDSEDLVSLYLQPAALAAIVDFRQRLKGDFGHTAMHKTLLRDLMSGRSISTADQERLERHFGFDLCDGFFVLAVQLLNEEGMVMSVSNWPLEPFVGTDIEGTQVYVVPVREDQQKTWQEESTRLVESIKELYKDGRLQLGAGRKVETLMELAETYREARQALIVGSMIYANREFKLGYAELGVKRLLYLVYDHPELERFYKEILEPLETYDEEWETELVATLKVYLEHGANLNSAARALFIHRHTLRYRLEQIADLLKVDIDSQESLLNMQIAFQIRDLYGLG
jgi:Sugar diacid utilization regulator